MNSVLLIILLFFILWGCSQGEQVRLIEQSQTPNVIGNGTPANVAVSAQTPVVVESNEKPVVIEGGELCEEYLLRKIAKEKAEGSRIAKLKAFNTDDESLSPELKEWLQTSIHVEMLVTFELQRGEKKSLNTSSK